MSPGRWKYWHVCSLAVLLAACVGAPEPGPSQLLGFSDLRYQDFFSSSDVTWDQFTVEGDAAFFRVFAGVLQGAVVANRGYIHSLNNRRAADISIEASVRQTRGAPGNGFGLLCRADDTGNGYYFVISSDGNFAILRADLTHPDPIPLVPWKSSDVLRRGEDVNLLRAVCVDDYLAFFANSRFLAEARDSTFTIGESGVVIAAVGQAAWFAFDSITLRDVSILRSN